MQLPRRPPRIPKLPKTKQAVLKLQQQNFSILHIFNAMLKVRIVQEPGKECYPDPASQLHNMCMCPDNNLIRALVCFPHISHVCLESYFLITRSVSANDTC